MATRFAEQLSQPMWNRSPYNRFKYVGVHISIFERNCTITIIETYCGNKKRNRFVHLRRFVNMVACWQTSTAQQKQIRAKFSVLQSPSALHRVCLCIRRENNINDTYIFIYVWSIYCALNFYISSRWLFWRENDKYTYIWLIFFLLFCFYQTADFSIHLVGSTRFAPSPMDKCNVWFSGDIKRIPTNR